MKAQEVITIFSDVPHDLTTKTYPELEEWFDKGMYIESFQQSYSPSTGKYILTFVMRYYNVSTS